MTSTLPDKTTVLIIGAGPTGLATAISLAHEGFRDFIIVDEILSKGPASRAVTLHAATLEALDSVGCAEPLIELGIKGKAMEIWDRSTQIFNAEFACLEPYTKFPYVLIVSQSVTEEVLENHLKLQGISVLRSERAVGFQKNDHGELDVHFESGRVITARYVIGADGAKSTIRQSAGVSFADSEGTERPEQLAQMILADVTFSSPSPYLPTDTIRATSAGGKLFLTVRMPFVSEAQETVYRVGFNVPLSDGPPPHSPPISYIQKYMNEQGPIPLSSDPNANPNPIHISKAIWATRFRTHAAIAGHFLINVGHGSVDSDDQNGTVLLVGDAAHIHAPAGGLGMNLGIRDAMKLGTSLTAHIKLSSRDPPDKNTILESYASDRRDRALSTIRLTKRLMTIANTVGSTRLLDVRYWVIRLFGKIPIVRNMMVWNLSGLGNR